MKRVNVKIIDLYGNTKFEDLNKKFNDVYSVISSLNNCISDISSDMRDGKRRYECTEKILTTIKYNILDKFDEEFLSHASIVNDFLKNEKDKDTNIIDFMLEFLDEFRRPLYEARTLLMRSVYTYSTETDCITSRLNDIFVLKEKLIKNKDGNLIQVLNSIYDIYSKFILYHMLKHEYFTKGCIEILYDFITNLRNALIDYAGNIEISTYIDD